MLLPRWSTNFSVLSRQVFRSDLSCTCRGGLNDSIYNMIQPLNFRSSRSIMTSPHQKQIVRSNLLNSRFRIPFTTNIIQRNNMSTSAAHSESSSPSPSTTSPPETTTASQLLSLLSTTPSHSISPLSSPSSSSPPPQSPLYAILEIAGRPLHVTPQDILVLNRINSPSQPSSSADPSTTMISSKKEPLPPGTVLQLNRVREIGSKDYTLRGNPYVSPSYYNIEAIMLENPKGPKVTIVKKKRRKGYRVKRGHRQLLSVVRIRKIEVVVPEENSNDVAKRAE
ncbi:ribosomal protein L21-like protein [Paraphysoderma sedebokerense]|nr:ribosomal protein L21-like protein [Paraphysoderma sedebokerense]